MDSHLRIKFTASLTALQDLEPYSYKVLMYLATRADNFGICFPAPKTIAEHIGISVNCVYDKLQELFTWGYAKLLRNAFYDRLTKKSSPAVFQVSPHFMEIADSFFAEALEYWNTGFQIHVKHGSNQQQEPPALNNTIETESETTTTTNNRDSEKESAKSEPPKTTAQPTNSAQRTNRESSGFVKKYTNPILITSELESLQESLAVKLSELEIKITLARGFITEYGYGQCDVAYNHLQVLLERQEIENPSGFYRYLLQSNMANVLTSMRDKKDDSHRREYDDYLES